MGTSLPERLESPGDIRRDPPFHLLAMADTLLVSLHLLKIEINDISTSEKLIVSTASVTASIISKSVSMAIVSSSLSINVTQYYFEVKFVTTPFPNSGC